MDCLEELTVAPDQATAAVDHVARLYAEAIDHLHRGELPSGLSKVRQAERWLSALAKGGVSPSLSSREATDTNKGTEDGHDGVLADANHPDAGGETPKLLSRLETVQAQLSSLRGETETRIRNTAGALAEHRERRRLSRVFGTQRGRQGAWVDRNG